MYTLWYSGRPALPLFRASGVNGEPTYTQERQFLGRIRSPSLVYSGRWRPCAVAVFVPCRSAKTKLVSAPRASIATAYVRCFLMTTLLLRRVKPVLESFVSSLRTDCSILPVDVLPSLPSRMHP